MPEDAPRPRLEILALAICVAGLLGLAASIVALKQGASLPRLGVLAFLAMTCAPFYVALTGRPKPLHLLPGLLAVFLLYPIAAPHGVVYSRDPLFNYLFSHRLVEDGYWAPGSLTSYAKTYSYYPLGNAFLSAGMSASGLPGPVAYLWAEPLVRLLALPAAVYAIGRRLYGPREAAVGLLLYLGTGSILFNLPVQQGMGVVFMALSLLALTIVASTKDPQARLSARVLFMLSSVAVVMTHHLSSYFLAIWLGLAAAISLLPRHRVALRPVGLAPNFLFYFVVLAAYIALLTSPLLVNQTGTLENAIANFIEPETGPAKPVALGKTFAPYETAWLAGSVVLLMWLVLRTRRHLRATLAGRFVRVMALSGILLQLATLPLIVTSLNYVPLRFAEFVNLLFGPVAAFLLVRWVRKGTLSHFRLLPRALRRRRELSLVGAVAVAAVVFLGGQLAPLSLRAYFDPLSLRTTDSPLYVGGDILRLGDWAHDHLNRSRYWSDQLGMATLGGFGDMRGDFGHYRVFQNESLDPRMWARLSVGDYVAVNSLMTTLRPDFLDVEGPEGPLPPAAVAKFSQSRHFAAVYQDATFTVYRVMSEP